MRVNTRCMKALWELISLLAVDGPIQSPMLGQGLHSFLKDLASLPNRDFRLRGLNNNFDVDSVLEGEVKGKEEGGGTMAWPSSCICTDPTLNGHIDAAA